ncbi:hypothetical protein AAF712_005152 [Marasmius tenuissimus]|uniref:C2H2-type domain-containing protein n=1 Tax=Marasmius tenuissimus TaxID=585030 RepID=A0ABR3A1A3_9AGAR
MNTPYNNNNNNNTDEVTFTFESDCETTASNHWETQGVGHNNFTNFALDPGFDDRFISMNGSGSEFMPAPGVEDNSRFLDPTNQSPVNTIMNGMATLNMDFCSPAPQTFYESSGYSSSEEPTHSVLSSSPIYSHAPQSPMSPTSPFYSSGDEMDYPLTVQIDPGTRPASPHNLPIPHTPPLSPGYTSDSASTHSFDMFGSQRLHGDTLTVPASSYPAAPRGRPRHRVQMGGRHPYSRPGPSTTFNNFSDLGNTDFSVLRSMPIAGPSRRPRSSSIVSTSSSFNGDVSDSEGYYSSQEPLEGYPHFSRDSSPYPMDRAMSNDDVFGGFDTYRSNIGSAAIVKASIDRRKKNAKFVCTEPGCTSDFTTKQNLKNHMNSHFGIKGFECSFCGKPFTTMHVRGRHQNTCKKNPERIKTTKTPQTAYVPSMRPPSQ